VSVRVGTTIFFTDQSIDPTTLALELEARGYASLYVPEHTHIPVSRRTPAPTGDDELAEEYRRCLDPLVALAMAAAAAPSLVVGSGISLAAQHHPISYAKQWATLDHLTGGRTVFGVGFGWNVEEMAAHGVAYATRREQVREHVLAMQALWANDEAGFQGEYVSFEPTWSWPKPVQQPRIPTFIGGSPGPKMFAHISEYADGWMPIGGAGVRAAIPVLHEAWAAAGRVGTPLVMPFGVMPSPGKLAFYRELGCSEVVLRIPSAPRDEVLRALDELDAHVAELA
jgi:probable F420-dependent oxidoreductase